MSCLKKPAHVFSASAQACAKHFEHKMTKGPQGPFFVSALQRKTPAWREAKKKARQMSGFEF